MLLHPPPKRHIKFALGLIAVGAAFATDLTIRLPGKVSISRKTVTYQCDSEGPKIGLPSSPFPVEYLNGGGNSLAIVPVSGNALIFSNVIAGSGARYVAGKFTWWEAGGSATIYSDSLASKMRATCKPAKEQHP